MWDPSFPALLASPLLWAITKLTESAAERRKGEHYVNPSKSDHAPGPQDFSYSPVQCIAGGTVRIHHHHSGVRNNSASLPGSRKGWRRMYRRRLFHHQGRSRAERYHNHYHRRVGSVGALSCAGKVRGV